jgi:HEAT repeat protein
VAHWLSRNQERFEDDATRCHYETQVSGGGRSTGGRAGGGGVPGLNGSEWHKRLMKMARDPKLDPLEKLFGKTAQNQLTDDDHKRAWSIFDYCLREWREPFVAVIRDLRNEIQVRDTFVKNLQCTPEVFDRRWRERVLGKRKSMDPKKAEAGVLVDNEDPTEKERRRLREEEDMSTLAALIRGLGTLDDPRTAITVVDQLERKSELIREGVMVSLLKIKDPEVKEAVWKHGLSHKHAMVRAYVARAAGRLHLEDAIPLLRKQLEDKNWYARAEAALALGMLKDHDSMAGMRKMLKDRAQKARVAAMDALASFGEDAFRAREPVEENLKSTAWQLRVASCQTLAKLGRMESIDPLIERMELESGRVRDAIHEALKEISRDDLGKNPHYWREWWEKEKVNSPHGLPVRPDAPKNRDTGRPDPDDRYAKQEYYGIELYSSRIGFVLDTSLSMKVNFEPSPMAARRLSREYSGFDKLTICKEEIAQALRTLDPRAHFNIISFGSTVRNFKKNPVLATSGNIASGESFLRSLPPNGETNYFDALRSVLDLGDGPDTNPNFRDTPDTLTFLTDGTPTKGEITHPDTLLEWYTGLNRFARVKTHVICFGNTGVDFDLLQALAGRNNGKYVHIPSKDRE